MNKYIKTYIESGYKFLKAGIMNALHDVKSGEEKRIDFGHPVPISLIRDCLDELDWPIVDIDFDWIQAIVPNSKLHIFVTEDYIIHYYEN